MKRLLLFGVLLSPLVVVGAPRAVGETLDLRLRVVMKYSDADRSCETGRLGVDFLIKGKVESGELKSLVISNHPREWAFQWIYKELSLPVPARSHPIRKVDGRWWLNEIVPSKALLNWIFNVGLVGKAYCAPQRPVTSTSPNISSAKFELDGVESGIEVSYSESFQVSGTRDDKVSYSAKIRFVQRSPSEAEELFPQLNPWGK